MGLNFAIDELYATGWFALDSAGCAIDASGRHYPSVDRVTREFREEGFELELRDVQLFVCVRATWSQHGTPMGSVVGQSTDEAAVHALARLRQAVSAAAAGIA